MENWTLTIVIAFLLALIIWRELQNIKERKDLIDRLMSSDFQEYKRLTKPSARKAFPAAMTDAEMAMAQHKLDMEKKGKNA